MSMIERFNTALNHFMYLTSFCEVLVPGRLSNVRLEYSYNATTRRNHFMVVAILPGEDRARAMSCVATHYKVSKVYGKRPEKPEGQFNLTWEE